MTAMRLFNVSCAIVLLFKPLQPQRYNKYLEYANICTKIFLFCLFFSISICQRSSHLPFGHIPFIHLLVHVPFGYGFASVLSREAGLYLSVFMLLLYFLRCINAPCGEPGCCEDATKNKMGEKDYPRAAALRLFASGRGECGLQESDDKYK
jgi:hypothetical protein